MKWLIISLIILTLYTTSCSHLSPNGRSLASIDEGTCSGLMKTIVKADETDELDEDLQYFIKKQAQKYWDWHNNITWWRVPAYSLGRLRAVSTKVLQSWNAHPVPLLYIDDKSATQASIIKYESLFKRYKVKVDEVGDEALESAALKEARESIDKWIARYKTYPDRLNQKAREFFALQFAIKNLNTELKSVKDFPRIIEIERMIPVNPNRPELGKRFQIDKFLVKDNQDIRTKRLELTRAKKLIVSSVLRKGSRREVVVGQAKDRKRLEMLHDRLVNIKLSNDANGYDNEIELLEMINNLDNILYKRNDLTPSPNIVMRLESRELFKEAQGLFNQLKESEFNQKLKTIYETLSPEEKKMLGLDGRSLLGATINFVVKNRVVIGVGLFASTGTAYLNGEAITDKVGEWINYFSDDYEKRQNCINTTEKKFRTCVASYLIDKFADKVPPSYQVRGISGLKEAIDKDSKLLKEFTQTKELIAKERAEKNNRDQKDQEALDEWINEIDTIVKNNSVGFQSGPDTEKTTEPPVIKPIPSFNP